jgi:hypothetical protein
MKSPKPATDNRFKTLIKESYGNVEILYINVDNF